MTKDEFIKEFTEEMKKYSVLAVKDGKKIRMYSQIDPYHPSYYFTLQWKKDKDGYWNFHRLKMFFRYKTYTSEDELIFDPDNSNVEDFVKFVLLQESSIEWKIETDIEY